MLCVLEKSVVNYFNKIILAFQTNTALVLPKLP